MKPPLQPTSSNRQLVVAWHEMAELRHDVWSHKVPYGRKYDPDAVESNGKGGAFCLAFRTSIEQLADTLVDYCPVVLQGGMSPKAKQLSIDLPESPGEGVLAEFRRPERLSADRRQPESLSRRIGLRG